MLGRHPFARHAIIFVALVVNLWVGGDMVESVAGPYARGGFELLLISGYLVFVLRLMRLFQGDEQPPS